MVRAYCLLTLAFFVGLPTSPADDRDERDERDAKKQSSASSTADQLDQYEIDVRSLDRKFLDEMERLEKSYVGERRTLRKKLSESLNDEMKDLTKKGDLDQAVVVRDHIETLEATQIVPPSQSSPQGILGTWRWNNGVDITNLEHGLMNGDGTWRLVDAGQQVYEFQWKKIPADRVRLSPNGRVLEGTKANDSKFQVWAVRID
jgi:hypothetical protein